MDKQKIFRIYSENLHLLVDNGFLTNINLIHSKTYICPICLRQFGEEALLEIGPNSLTLEDVPQKALGGKANILTCGRCNNYFGVKVDWHLIERLNELNNRKFSPNTQFWAKATNRSGVQVNMNFKVGENGIITALSTIKNNSPGATDRFNNTISHSDESKIVDVNFKPSRVNLDYLKFALLKNAYLLMFQRYGYAFLYEQTYQRVRNQLLDINTIIYPTDNWLAFPDEQVLPPGIYWVDENDLFCFLIIFELRTKATVRYILAYLPLIWPIQYVAKGIQFRQNNDFSGHQLKSYFGFELPLGKFKLTLEKVDYNINDLTNENRIQELFTWLDDKRNRL